MPTTDKVKAGSVSRIQADKLTDFYSSKDFGGVSNGTTDDTTAINSGITFLIATYGGGVLYLPPNTVYTEVSLVLDSRVLICELSKNGKIKYLIHDEGYSLPVLKGGVEIKTQSKDGILLSSHDSGIAGAPYLRILDSISGQLASLYCLNSQLAGYAELQETAVPAAPSANGARIFLVDDGSGNTQLAVRFNTGTTQYLATQNMESSVTYDPPSLTTGSGATTTVTVTGAALGNYVEVSFDKDLQGIQLTAYVSVAGVVSCRFQNQTGGTIDLASGTLKVKVMK